MTSRSWWMLATLCFSTFHLRMSHGFSIGFISDDILGQSIPSTLSFFNKGVVILEACLGSLLCYNTALRPSFWRQGIMLIVISRGCRWEIDVEVLPALLKGWEVSLLVLRPYATYSIKLVSMAVVPEGCLFHRWCTRKAANSGLKTTRPRTWITGTMSCGPMRPR